MYSYTKLNKSIKRYTLNVYTLLIESYIKFSILEVIKIRSEYNVYLLSSFSISTNIPTFYTVENHIREECKIS